MLKVGDKVMNTQDNSIRHSEVGTIIAVDKSWGTMPYLVEYKNPIPEGHNGNLYAEIRGKEGHCWWENGIQLKKIGGEVNINLLEKICNELGVEIGEVWRGNDGSEYKITQNGVLIYIEYNSNPTIEINYFEKIDDISRVLIGQLKPVWKPKDHEVYYTISFFDEDPAELLEWGDRGWERGLLKRGLVFKTKEEAIACAEKMLKAIKGE